MVLDYEMYDASRFASNSYGCYDYSDRGFVLASFEKMPIGSYGPWQRNSFIKLTHDKVVIINSITKKPMVVSYYFWKAVSGRVVNDSDWYLPFR